MTWSLLVQMRNAAPNRCDLAAQRKMPAGDLSEKALYFDGFYTIRR
jgi:hypothetical protein